MKSKYFRWGLLALIAAIWIPIFTGWKLNAAGDTAPAIGHLAPNFSLPDLNGRKIQLQAITSHNKVTLVNFWATWCSPCRGEIPELVKLYQKYGQSRLALLAVNLREERGLVKTFATEHGMKFTVLTDTAGTVADQYQIGGIPTTFIVDRHGRIRDFIVGGTTFAVLKTKIQALLKEE